MSVSSFKRVYKGPMEVVGSDCGNGSSTKCRVIEERIMSVCCWTKANQELSINSDKSEIDIELCEM